MTSKGKHLVQQTAKLMHGRNIPPSYAYTELSKVDLDIEPFKDESVESNRSEKELSQYLTSLYGHIQKRRRAIPRHRNKNESETLFKPLYDYSKTKTTETDLRPSYHKFMENMESTNPELFQQLKEPLETEQLIDMNYLCLHENRNPPKVLPDSEYPDWVWELVPESRRYWWTDLVQTPFENLSEVEQFQLLRKWRKTLMISNNQWTKSHLGSLGKVRPKYNDPWPRPITKMDIAAYQQKDPYWNEAKEWVKRFNLKNKKRLESDSDYLLNQNMVPIDLEADDAIDLAQYYGLEGGEEQLDVDCDGTKKDGVVYEVKR